MVSGASFLAEGHIVPVQNRATTWVCVGLPRRQSGFTTVPFSMICSATLRIPRTLPSKSDFFWNKACRRLIEGNFMLADIMSRGCWFRCSSFSPPGITISEISYTAGHKENAWELQGVAVTGMAVNVSLPQGMTTSRCMRRWCSVG